MNPNNRSGLRAAGSDFKKGRRSSEPGTPSRPFYLLTAFGKDRPGIVADVAHALYELGGNVEDASMTRLGGEFAMVLVVGLPDAASVRQLSKALRALAKKGHLSVQAKPISEKLAHAAGRSEPTHLVSVYGTDRPGIVYKVAQVLANRGININDLNTKISLRSGAPFYVMLLEIQVPAGAKVEDLRAQLERLGRLLNIEITLQEIESVAL